MKSFAILAAAAGVALAQDLGSLSQCGQQCISNMLAIAQGEFGCAPGNTGCYCSDARFAYGVRDCSNEACSAEEAAAVQAFGLAYCANVVSTGGAEATTGALPVLSSAVASLTGSAGEVASSVGASASDVIASATGSAASAASSVESSLLSVVSSLTESAASAQSSLAGEASSLAESATDAANSLASDASAAVSSALNTGAAPMVTGVPVAGAAVGLAAWLLL